MKEYLKESAGKGADTSAGSGARRMLLLFLLALMAGCAMMNQDKPLFLKNGSPEVVSLATAQARGQPTSEWGAAGTGGGGMWNNPPTATPPATTTPAPTATPQHTITPQPTATPAATATPQPTPTPQPTVDLAPISTAVAAVNQRMDGVERDVGNHSRLLARIQQEVDEGQNIELLLYGLAAVLVLVLVGMVSLARQPVASQPAPHPNPQHIPQPTPPAPSLPRPPQNMEELFRLPSPQTFGEQTPENAERLARHIQAVPNWREVSKNKSELWRRVWPAYSRQDTPAPSLGGNWHWLMNQALEQLSIASSTSSSTPR